MVQKSNDLKEEVIVSRVYGKYASIELQGVWNPLLEPIKILEKPYYAASIYATLTFCNHPNGLKQQEHLWKSCNVIGSRLGVP